MDEALTAISTVGFPIVACLILGYLLIQEQSAHKEETKELSGAISQLTIVMTEFKQLLKDLAGLNNDD